MFHFGKDKLFRLVSESLVQLFLYGLSPETELKSEIKNSFIDLKTSKEERYSARKLPILLVFFFQWWCFFLNYTKFCHQQ